MDKFHMRVYLLIAAIAIGLMVFAGSAVADSIGTPCTWKITGVQAGKWGNGNQKAALWPKGSFPIPIGTSERPTWYVNGINCGKSQMCAGCGASTRFLPNSSQYLRDGETNTITLEYSKSPCSGASSSKRFPFQWSQVPNGGYKTFK